MNYKIFFKICLFSLTEYSNVTHVYTPAFARYLCQSTHRGLSAEYAWLPGCALTLFTHPKMYRKKNESSVIKKRINNCHRHSTLCLRHHCSVLPVCHRAQQKQSVVYSEVQ